MSGNQIHPAAHIGENVRMGEGNVIGPGCSIEDGVVIGSKNHLWMQVYVGPGTTIGDENQIHMGAVVGHVPQDIAYAGAPSYTRLGNRNTVREYVTIHRGTKEGSATVIGDDNFIMANAHIAHNCQLGNRIIMVNLASLTGYCEVADQAFISGIVGFHQFSRIGRLAMVSALSAVNKDVPPFMLCGGRPAVVQGINVVGMRRAGIGASARDEIKGAYRLLYREGLNVSNALEAIEERYTGPEARELVAFVRGSKRGICAGVEESDVGEGILPRKPRAETVQE